MPRSRSRGWCSAPASRSRPWPCARSRREPGYGRPGLTSAARGRRPRRLLLGYGLALLAVVFWSLHASIARFLLDDGIDPLRLAQLRVTFAAIALGAVLAVARPRLLGLRRDSPHRLLLFGVVGFALLHFAYFTAIGRLQIGVALTIQYLAPVLVLLWVKLVHRRQLPAGIWIAVGVSVGGCFMVARGWDVGAIDALGVLASLGAAAAYAWYLVGAEDASHRGNAWSGVFWALTFATLFWAVLQPWWEFPWRQLSGTDHLALVAGVVVIGTLVPFGLMAQALRHIPVSRGAVIATLEPALAALLAFFIHGQVLAAPQIAGAAAVLAAVAWIQAGPVDLEREALSLGGGGEPGARAGGG